MTLSRIVGAVRAALPETQFSEVRVPHARYALLLADFKDFEIGLSCVSLPRSGSSASIGQVDVGCRLPNLEEYVEQFELEGSEKFFGKRLERFPQLTFFGKPHIIENMESARWTEGLSVDLGQCRAMSREALEECVQRLDLPAWAIGPQPHDIAMRASTLAWLRDPARFFERAREILQLARGKDPHYVAKAARFVDWLSTRAL